MWISALRDLHTVWVILVIFRPPSPFSIHFFSYSQDDPEQRRHKSADAPQQRFVFWQVEMIYRDTDTMIQSWNGATHNDLMLFVMPLIFIVIITTLTGPWLRALVSTAACSLVLMELMFASQVLEAVVILLAANTHSNWFFDEKVVNKTSSFFFFLRYLAIASLFLFPSQQHMNLQEKLIKSEATIFLKTFDWVGGWK